MKYLLWSHQYGAWLRPQGYTYDLAEATRYTKREAVKREGYEDIAGQLAIVPENEAATYPDRLWRREQRRLREIMR